ncbi:hypothetical protein [Campylobacter novaezeelandiae]|uniref:hypothetical protein n=1 Tax=Campylobacter novaezeelandiae TaxID=2267891 RepID=UPI0019032DE2|nr:hypothetical protein [Campylobacter novaezeelandiae]MBK1964344.1 hypothetical protein [Campylobacter novaezeelandiae]MBK1993312.1 hypothetical protein [Campylobacter novaezeelandiae]
MFKKAILFFLMGFVLLQANSLDKCNNIAVISKLKKQIPKEISKNLHELFVPEVDYEEFEKKLKEIYEETIYSDIVKIDSISNFSIILDSCMTMINATFQEKKGLWSIAYKVSNLNQVEIIDITYLNGDFNEYF